MSIDETSNVKQLGGALGFISACIVSTAFFWDRMPENAQPKAVDKTIIIAMAAPVFTLGGDMKLSCEKDGLLIQSESRCFAQNDKGCTQVLVDFRVGAEETVTNTALVKKDGQNFIVTWPTRDELKAMTEINSLTGKLPKNQAAPK